jgi:capsule polysaccharide export protein KpsE/RkpR
LESLKQIYTGENVRVRATQARVDELQRELQRLGGKYDGGTVATPENDKSMYPSIRELPLLGVSYADLYRTTKVQEAVFETLTREYELAKVQEAKETPSVKMIDPPNIPERKSFPPRLEIMLLGTVLATFLGIAWTFARATWEKTDPQDPHKVLAMEVYQTTKAHFPWTSQNGFGVGAASKRLWSQLRRRQLDRV